MYGIMKGTSYATACRKSLCLVTTEYSFSSLSRLRSSPASDISSGQLEHLVSNCEAPMLPSTGSSFDAQMIQPHRSG